MKYSSTATVIEDASNDEWSVSLTNHNPEASDCIVCKTEQEAWKLKTILDLLLGALNQVSNLDYTQAAVNCCAFEANKIAVAALSNAEVSKRKCLI